MRYVIVILVFLVGAASGWLLRDATTPEPAPARAAPRQASQAPAPSPSKLAPPPAPSPAPPQPAAEKAPAPEKPAQDEPQVAQILRRQMPALRVMASTQARTQAEAIARELSLDEEQTRMLAEAVAKISADQMEKAFQMLLGEGDVDPDSLDANAFMLMQGAAQELPKALEAELVTFLSDDEIDAVRQTMRKRYDKQMDTYAEMQLAMMQVPDMTEDQRRQVKDVLLGHDQMQEQLRSMAGVMHDPERRKRLLRGEGLDEEIRSSMAPRRERMRTILSPQQFEKYLAYEKTLVDQAKMGLKMFGLGAKTKPAPQAPKEQPAGR